MTPDEAKAQASRNPKKTPDVETEALKAKIAEATILAEAEGVTVGAGWSLDKIEAATLKAMQAKENLAKDAAAEAAKPAPVAQPRPSEDADARAEVMKAAHAAGMDLEDLKGRPLADVLSMIGKHVTEQKMRNANPQDADVGRVKVRVLKAGDNKISKGIHIPGVGDICYKQGDEITLVRENARQLEARGFLEIVG